MKISKYVSLQEATKSDTAVRRGINNIPSTEIIEKMKVVAIEFDRLREFAGGPLHVNSFYRSPELNNAIGGAKQSQHMKGEAIDIDCDQYGFSSNAEIFKWSRLNIKFDQLIWEFGTKENPDWIHLSKVDYRDNRGEVLRAYKTEDGQTRYVQFDL